MEIEEPRRVLEQFYIKGEYFANGSFGQVSKGISRINPNKIVAIKEVDRRKFQKQYMEILIKTLEREIEYNIKLKEANCPFIVEFIQHFETEYIIYFVFQFCENTLSNLIGRYQGPAYFGKRQYILVKILYEMLLTLKVLENNHLIHRDIKPENILICGGVGKLADFGFCRELDANLTSGRGSLRTTAPESHTSTFYNKCDIWSLGVSIHNCLYGLEPFEQKLRNTKDHLKFRQVIMSKEFQVEIRRESRISEILQKMIVVEESQRASVEELLNHPLFKIERFATTSEWIRGWLIFSSVLTFQKKDFDCTMLAVVAVAFSQCKIYLQLYKAKSKQIYFFAFMFLILQLFIKMLIEMKAFSPQNLRFVQAINSYYDQNFFQDVIKRMRSSHKSDADSVQKLYRFLISGSNITKNLVQLRSLCESNPDDQVKKRVISQYPDFIIFPKLNKIIQRVDKLKWGLNNIILNATKQPLKIPKFFFNQRQQYHDQISIF